MFKPRFYLLWVALVVAALVAVMVLTPLDFELHHLHCNCYPELAWVTFGAPNALALLIAGVTVALFGKSSRARAQLSLSWIAAAMASATLTLFVSAQEFGVRPHVSQRVIDAVSYAGLFWAALSVAGLFVALLSRVRKAV